MGIGNEHDDLSNEQRIVPLNFMSIVRTKYGYQAGVVRLGDARRPLDPLIAVHRDGRPVRHPFSRFCRQHDGRPLSSFARRHQQFLFVWVSNAVLAFDAPVSLSLADSWCQVGFGSHLGRLAVGPRLPSCTQLYWLNSGQEQSLFADLFRAGRLTEKINNGQ